MDSKLWRFHLEGGELILDIGLKINLRTKEKNLSSDIKKLDQKISDRYDFTDFYLDYNQRSLIQCFDPSGTEKWRQKIQGYLCTPIQRINNHLHWGTAGKGGAFYFMDASNGQIRTEYKNGDSSNYLFLEEYVLLPSKKGKLIRLNPYQNEVLEELKLSGRMVHSPIQKINQRIWIISHNLNKGLAYLNILEVE
ncbi:MAG: hypothetical protein AAF696_33105 [Bacteroidota bacterium]